jgi:hypothetical protein
LRAARIGDEPEGAPLDDLDQVENHSVPLGARVRAAEAVDHQRIARQVELDTGRRSRSHVLEIGLDIAIPPRIQHLACAPHAIVPGEAGAVLDV